MKKFAALLLTLILCLTAVSALAMEPVAKEDLKIGAILVGDEYEGYTLAHMEGILAAARNLGLDESQIIWKRKIEENASCTTAAEDLFDQGCQIIISNSYGHQDYMNAAAEEFAGENVAFVAMTGDYAAISGKDNFYNAFTKVFQSRYVSGVVAGMKVAELVENGTISPDKTPNNYTADGKVKIGYVGAFPYAEVVSGYTAFFLGIRSIYPDVEMEVTYTNSWFDISAEAAAGEALVANGCVIVGQHADSTGAPSALQKLLKAGTVCYSVGYNIDMLEVAPDAALTSPTNGWDKYYTDLFTAVINGEEVPQDWAKGYEYDAVGITPLGASCAPGTAEKVAEVEAALADGSLKVFDVNTFTVGGEPVVSAPVDLSYLDWSQGGTVVYAGETVEAIVDGAFAESEFRAAPYFSLRIDGIIEDAQ